MEHKVEFRYGIKDKVKILSIGMDGRVTAMRVDEDGLSYLVTYWWNGERRQLWMYEWEIE